LYRLSVIELLLKVIPVEDFLFDSEMVGAVRGIASVTGRYFDVTKRYLALRLTADREKIFEGDARKVFPRLAAKIAPAARATNS
jgi:4-oxalmesaconate hydratase